MQYQITSDNIEISESMKALAMEKFEKISSRMTEKEQEEALVRIVMNKSGGEGEFEVSVELTYSGNQYYGVDTNYTVETAIIEAIAEVERMRKKDEAIHQDAWKEQRELKRDLGEVIIAEDLVENEDTELSDEELV